MLQTLCHLTGLVFGSFWDIKRDYFAICRRRQISNGLIFILFLFHLNLNNVPTFLETELHTHHQRAIWLHHEAAVITAEVVAWAPSAITVVHCDGRNRKQRNILFSHKVKHSCIQNKYSEKSHGIFRIKLDLKPTIVSYSSAVKLHLLNSNKRKHRKHDFL